MKPLDRALLDAQLALTTELLRALHPEAPTRPALERRQTALRAELALVRHCATPPAEEPRWN